MLIYVEKDIVDHYNQHSPSQVFKLTAKYILICVFSLLRLFLMLSSKPFCLPRLPLPVTMSSDSLTKTIWWLHEMIVILNSVLDDVQEIFIWSNGSPSTLPAFFVWDVIFVRDTHDLSVGISDIIDFIWGAIKVFGHDISFFQHSFLHHGCWCFIQIHVRINVRIHVFYMWGAQVSLLLLPA